MPTSIALFILPN